MDATLVSAMAGVLGSLVGGSATVATAWVTQATLNRRELMIAEIRQREGLYGEFIRECSKLVMDSFSRTLDEPATLVSLYELLNRIRLSASDPVLAQAEEVKKRIVEQYFGANRSVEDLRALARSGGNDPLRSFGQACRSELKAMRRTSATS